MPSKFYVTTPIYYPNSKPHMGTLYTTLLADIFARWNKLFGHDVFFLTGLDEHGQKIAEAAVNKGLSPQAFVDEMAKPFLNVWQKYDLSFDKFIRTTSQEHVNGVLELFKILKEKGFIYKDSYSGYYCTPCEAYLSPGSTPDIKYCSIHNKPTEEIVEENYFFKLSLFQDKLLKFYQDNPTFIQPQNRLNEIISFVQAGLKDLSITRKSVKWGIPFPDDQEHTIYVWGDALTNYLTGVGYGNGDELSSQSFAKFWPPNLQIIGKDIVRFHAVYWPAFIMAAELELPKKLLVHGYILTSDQKMSKSSGNAIDPLTLAETIGVVPVRYYLAKQIAVTQDSPFSIEELIATYNADLANNFGNLVNRVISLSLKNNLEEIFVQTPTLELCKNLFDQVEINLNKILSNMNDLNLPHMALGMVMTISSSVNAMINQSEPWKVVQSNKNNFIEIMSCAAQVMLLCSKLLYPFIPSKINELWDILGRNGLTQNNFFSENLANGAWQETFILKPSTTPLFPRIEIQSQETPLTEEPKPQINEVSFEDFAKVKIAVGLILFASLVDGSDKLLKLEVDFGEFGKRQVVSGIAKFYKPEFLIGKKTAFVINLQPRKIMGLESQAMILAAKDNVNFSIMFLENDSVSQGSILG